MKIPDCRSHSELFVMPQRRIKRLTVACLVIFTAVVFALKVENIIFEETLTRGPASLTLRGAGIKKFLSIRVAAAGLYLPKDSDSGDVLKDIPKSLEVVYLQNIPAIELQNATTKGIRLNVSPEEFKRLGPVLERVNGYYPSVRKMDRIRVTYIPGEGTTFEVNNHAEGTVPGEDFARAFFSIWVGDRPVDERIKQILLGKQKS